jgi:hypothetical protein
VDFIVEAEQVTVLGIRSGYRAAQLESAAASGESEALALHRQFALALHTGTDQRFGH